MISSKQAVIDWIEDHRQEYIDMAQAIWEHPELALHEFFAAKLQADYLEAQGFRVRRDVAEINTAFVAEWGEGRPILGFAGEYDALPALSQKCQPRQEPLVPGGAGHGCGHNLLGTAHVAAICAVKAWMEANQIQGTVRYYGCPAEESEGAKTFMAKAGLFDDLDAAFNFHPMNVNTALKGSMVGVTSMKFHFHGRSAHAGATPHLGRSALDAVELMNVGVNYLREHVTGDVRIHYSITNGGGAPNVVPADAESHYMIRALMPDTLREVTGRVRKVAQGAALMTETEVEEIFTNSLSSLLNNHYLADLQFSNMQVIGPIKWTEEEIQFAREVNQGYPPGTDVATAAAYGIPTEFIRSPLLGMNFPPSDEGKVITGSTDVGDLSWKTPLSMLCATSWTTASISHSWGVVACSGMSIGHKGMLHAAKTMALSAMDLLTNPEHIQRARAEFDQALAAHPYENPIPDGFKLPRYAPDSDKL